MSAPPDQGPILFQGDSTAPADPLADLDGFPGGDDQYQHWTRSLRFTEGIKLMADRAGAYWLIDLVASHQPAVRKRLRLAGERDFQVWMLRVGLPDRPRAAVAECTDDLPPRLGVLARQEIPCTDFPRAEMRLWCVDGVLMLPSEY
jgi:hypothetical protein